MLVESHTAPEGADPPPHAQVCAVIVTYNIGEAIHRCFDSIQSQVGHVLIVDNGSDEATLRELHKLESSNAASLILNRRNEGIARAYNQAVQWVRSRQFRWMLTLDHDSEATPGMIDRLLQAYALLEQQGIGNAGIVGANPFDENNQHFLMYQPRESETMPLEDTEVISSGSLITLGVFDAVSRFNEDLFIYYVDTDFCMRLTRSGFRIFVCPEAILLHREGTKRRRKFLWLEAQYDHYSREARYYLTRNTLYMIRKHPLSRTDIFWMLRRLCKDHVKILLYDDDRLPILRYSLRGLLDGMHGKVGSLTS